MDKTEIVDTPLPQPPDRERGHKLPKCRSLSLVWTRRQWKLVCQTPFRPKYKQQQQQPSVGPAFAESREIQQ